MWYPWCDIVMKKIFILIIHSFDVRPVLILKEYGQIVSMLRILEKHSAKVVI